MNITLATLAQATEQEVFDQVARHLLAQGVQSTMMRLDGVSTTCQYRGEGGRKCAAGALIGDDEYRPWMDSDSLYDAYLLEHGLRGVDLDPYTGEDCNKVECTSWEDLTRFGVVPSAHKGLIAELQILHDTCPPKHWEQELARLAKARGLRTEALDSAPI